MKRPVLLAVAAGAADFAELFEALAAAGERAGWLEVGAAGDAAIAAAERRGLEEAAAAGVLRAVAVGDGRVTAVKPVAGEPVLDDLLREHFRGCRLVLVRGGGGLPRLGREGSLWRLDGADGSIVRATGAELAAKLRRPSFQRRLGGDPAGRRAFSPRGERRRRGD